MEIKQRKKRITITLDYDLIGTVDNLVKMNTTKHTNPNRSNILNGIIRSYTEMLLTGNGDK